MRVVLIGTGKAVGRIFRQTVAPGNPNDWFWGLDFFEAKGRRPFYGNANSKDAAKQALRSSGELSSASFVRLPAKAFASRD